jgi:hypothetical protein
MKKHTLTLSVVLLTVLGSFQNTHAMDGAKRVAQEIFSKAQAKAHIVCSTHFKNIKKSDIKVLLVRVGAGLTG